MTTPIPDTIPTITSYAMRPTQVIASQDMANVDTGALRTGLAGGTNMVSVTWNGTASIRVLHRQGTAGTWVLGGTIPAGVEGQARTKTVSIALPKAGGQLTLNANNATQRDVDVIVASVLVIRFPA